MSTTNWTVVEDYSATTFGPGQALSLFSLYHAHMRMGRQMIEGVTFDGCRIEGPSVMLPLSGCNFDGVNFGNPHGDPRNLVLRPAAPNGVIGAIPVRECLFRNVQFFAVGFTGSETFLQQLLALGPTQ